MSIMTDARLRLLEARVAEIERRLGANVGAPYQAVFETSTPTPVPGPAAKKAGPKPHKRSRKTP